MHRFVSQESGKSFFFKFMAKFASTIMITIVQNERTDITIYSTRISLKELLDSSRRKSVEPHVMNIKLRCFKRETEEKVIYTKLK